MKNDIIYTDHQKISRLACTDIVYIVTQNQTVYIVAIKKDAIRVSTVLKSWAAAGGTPAGFVRPLCAFSLKCFGQL